MKNFKTRAVITKLRKGNNSYYGNPSWFVYFTDCNGFTHYAKTASNASCAYRLGDYCTGKEFEISYHITNNGNMIIDYIEE